MSKIEYTSKTFSGIEVLFRNFMGRLTIEQEIKSLEYAVHNGLINENVKGMVLDMRSAEFDFVSKDAQLEHLKYAILVDSPNQIMYPILGSMYAESEKLKPFSTEVAAIKWIVAQ